MALMTYQDFCERYLPLKDKLFRYAWAIIGDRTEAEDVLQDTYEKLWLKRDRLPELENPEAYAFCMVKNLCFDKLKSDELHQEKLTSIKEELPTQTDGKKEELNNMYSIAEQVIASLPEKWRMVVHLRDVEGYEMEEIAQLMDEELSTLRVLLSRGRKAAREKMIKIMNYGIAQ